MITRCVSVAAALLLTHAALASANVPTERKDFQVLKDVSTSVQRYVHFTIFDDISANVKDGVVTLAGSVTMPYKKDDIEKRVAKIDGVRSVVDNIDVLPVSQFDDEL